MMAGMGEGLEIIWKGVWLDINVRRVRLEKKP